MERDHSTDITRGIAVVLMVASHVTWFFAEFNTPIWQSIRIFGDSICFVIFFFKFGVAQYFSFLSKPHSKELMQKGLKRLLNLFLVYYAIVLSSFLVDVKNNALSFEKIWKSLLFIEVPGFVEYFIPFILFALILLVLRKSQFLDRILASSRYFLILSVLGLFLFLFGVIVYEYSNQLYLPDVVKSYIALFALHKEFYLRFPVLQYSILPLLGLAYGKVILEKESKEISRKFLFGFLIFTSLTILLYCSQFFVTLNYFNQDLRFPPSLLFLTQNIAIMFAITLVVRYSSHFQFWKIIDSYGKNALGIMLLHIVLLYVLEFLNLPKSGNAFLIAIYFLIDLNAIYVYKFIKHRVGKENNAK